MQPTAYTRRKARDGPGGRQQAWAQSSSTLLPSSAPASTSYGFHDAACAGRKDAMEHALPGLRGGNMIWMWSRVRQSVGACVAVGRMTSSSTHAHPPLGAPTPPHIHPQSPRTRLVVHVYHIRACACEPVGDREALAVGDRSQGLGRGEREGMSGRERRGLQSARICAWRNEDHGRLWAPILPLVDNATVVQAHAVGSCGEGDVYGDMRGQYDDGVGADWWRRTDARGSHAAGARIFRKTRGCEGEWQVRRAAEVVVRVADTKVRGYILVRDKLRLWRYRPRRYLRFRHIQMLRWGGYGHRCRNSTKSAPLHRASAIAACQYGLDRGPVVRLQLDCRAHVGRTVKHE
ncbi:hypothetical protein C8J57DRAFT_1573300 [Mycena rebaudengoi]|nr:hypothetical protein C8J57DRAFT_1573300 [Mycena rebaudengoi]